MAHTFVTSRFSNRFLFCCMQAGTGLSVMGLCAVVVVLLGGVAYSLAQTGFAGLGIALGAQWNPYEGLYGILPMLVGSVVLAVMATVLAIPMCLGLTGFLWSGRKNALVIIVRFLVHFMIGIPTVVYGFCAVLLLVPLMRGMFAGTGLQLLTTTLVLSFLVLPTMILVLDSAMQQLLGSPEQLTLAATAAGLNAHQIFWLIALPVQKRWLLTGIMLSFGRALGDTMLPLMLSGNAPVMPGGLLSSVRTLATHISLLTATEIGPQVELTLYLAGTLLLLTTTAVSMSARMLLRTDKSTDAIKAEKGGQL